MNAELQKKDLQIKMAKDKFNEAINFIRNSKTESAAFLLRHRLNELDESVILISPKEQAEATAARTRARPARERPPLTRPASSSALLHAGTRRTLRPTSSTATALNTGE